MSNKGSFCDCGSPKLKEERMCESCKKTIRPRELKIGKKAPLGVLNLNNSKSCVDCGGPVSSHSERCKKCYLISMHYD